VVGGERRARTGGCDRSGGGGDGAENGQRAAAAETMFNIVCRRAARYGRGNCCHRAPMYYV